MTAVITKIPDSIIFDMDGTLWDGVATYALGFNDYFEAISSKRKVTRDDLLCYMGMEEEGYLAMTLPELSPKARKMAYQKIVNYQYQRITSDGGILYAGVKTGLKQLAQHYKLFIVSNCPEYTIQYFLKWAGVTNYITDFLAHGMNYLPKHKNIQTLVSKYQLRAPVYIGDTDSDRKQSELANVPFGFVSYGFGNSDVYAFKYNSFEELVQSFVAKRSNL